MSLKNHPVAFEVNESLTRLGNLIRLARVARGDSVATLSERLGVHRQTVARMESGDPGISAGLLFQALHLYGMTQRLLELSDTDEATTRLLERKALA